MGLGQAYLSYTVVDCFHMLEAISDNDRAAPKSVVHVKSDKNRHINNHLVNFTKVQLKSLIRSPSFKLVYKFRIEKFVNNLLHLYGRSNGSFAIDQLDKYLQNFYTGEGFFSIASFV